MVTFLIWHRALCLPAAAIENLSRLQLKTERGILNARLVSQPNRPVLPSYPCPMSDVCANLKVVDLLRTNVSTSQGSTQIL